MIKKITVEIGGVDYNFTLGELKKLHGLLDETFGIGTSLVGGSINIPEVPLCEIKLEKEQFDYLKKNFD